MDSNLSYLMSTDFGELFIKNDPVQTLRNFSMSTLNGQRWVQFLIPISSRQSIDRYPCLYCLRKKSQRDWRKSLFKIDKSSMTKNQSQFAVLVWPLIHKFLRIIILNWNFKMESNLNQITANHPQHDAYDSTLTLVFVCFSLTLDSLRSICLSFFACKTISHEWNALKVLLNLYWSFLN